MPRRAAFDPAAVDLLLAPGRAVASRRELMELGVPGSTITFRCRPEGPWQRILPGVVIGHRGTPTLHERRLAALRYAHPEAALCGLDALAAMGMRVRPGPDGHLVHVLVPDRCHRLSHGFAVVTRTKRLEVAGHHHGLPCVGAARAVVEAVRRMRVLGDVRALVAEAVQTRRCRPEDIAREIEQAARARTALGRAVLREIRAGVRSVAEAELRAALARHGVPAPRWNVTVRHDDGSLIAVVDALWERERVVVEVDSMEWHLGPEQYRATQRRQRLLIAAGWTVLSVAPGDVRGRPEEVCRQVLSALAAGR